MSDHPHDLTPASDALFRELVEMAPDWSGVPMVEVTREERGNLTQLKRAGLLVTDVSEGIPFATFTTAGREYARNLGLDWEDWFPVTHAPTATGD